MSKPRFGVTARETRGGWRGVILAHNGAVAFKTMPVFRERRDAETAARSWLNEHGAHADARRSRRPHKGAAVLMISTTLYGHVVGYDPDGSVMVRWSGKPSVVTGVAPSKLKIVPPGYAGSADARRGGYLARTSRASTRVLRMAAYSRYGNDKPVTAPVTAPTPAPAASYRRRNRY
jgi:hypothetical protein